MTLRSGRQLRRPLAFEALSQWVVHLEDRTRAQVGQSKRPPIQASSEKDKLRHSLSPRRMPGIIQDTGAEGDEVGPDAGRLVEDAPAKPRTPGLPPQIAKGEPPQRWQQDEGGWVLEVTNFRQPLVRQCADQGDEARRSAGASGAPNLRLARAES